MTGLSVLLALAVSAQQTGTRIPAPQEVQREERAQRVMSAFGRCVVSGDRAGAERYLAVLPRSPEASSAGAGIANSRCLRDGTQLSFDTSIFRGSLYEALYRADFRERHPAGLSDVPPLVYVNVDPMTLTRPQLAWLSLQSFGDCVVRASPGEARALILSEATRRGEDLAFAALTPALGPCLPQGLQLRFSRPILRGLIAESLYRLTAAAASRNAGTVRESRSR